MSIRMLASDDRIAFEIAGDDYQRLQQWLSEVGSKLATTVLGDGSSSTAVASSPLENLMFWTLDHRGDQNTALALEALVSTWVYEFSPSPLGLGAVVRNTATGDSLDLSDYGTW